VRKQLKSNVIDAHFNRRIAMTRAINLLKGWFERSQERLHKSEPITLREQFYLFTTRPTLHLKFTHDCLQDAIDDVQRILKDKGYLSKPSGRFDLETKQAVEEFQRVNDLKVDGIVGPFTWAALYYPKLCRSDRTTPVELQDAVRTLQDILNQEKFYSKQPDGQFDKETHRAVKCFQRTYGLKPDGIVDPFTWAVLFGMRQKPVEQSKFPAGFYIVLRQVLSPWQQYLMVYCILLGMYFSPEILNVGTQPNLAPALMTAIGLTCIAYLISENVLPRQRGQQKAPLLIQYGPYVLTGIFWNPVLDIILDTIRRQIELLTLR
jgi:peptidoglycan hydrolase-like protein with peptidoglycan-binding domain